MAGRMTRRERNLRRRLAYHLDKARQACAGDAATWSIDDCGIWQADIQLAATGFDPAKAYRGRYKTQRGAHRALGLLGLPMALQRLAGRARRIEPASARIGDVGLISAGKAFSCVRLLHRNEWIGRSPIGWAMVPTDMVRMAWRAV